MLHYCVLDCTVLLCDFHREQAWDRWLSATANGMRSSKDVALGCMRRIANSEMEEEYLQTVEDMGRLL